MAEEKSDKSTSLPKGSVVDIKVNELVAPVSSAWEQAFNAVSGRTGRKRLDEFKNQPIPDIEIKEVHSIAWGVLRVPLRTRWLAQDDDGAIYAFRDEPFYRGASMGYGKWAPSQPRGNLGCVGYRRLVEEAENRLYHLPE